MAKSKLPGYRSLRPRVPRKTTRSATVIRQYVDLGGSSSTTVNDTPEQLDAISRIDLVLPSGGTQVPPGGGFSFGGSNYKNETQSPILMPDPITEPNVLAAGFTKTQEFKREYLRVFEIFGVSSDRSLTQSDFEDAGGSLGLSANTSAQDITITLPQGIPDGYEFTVENRATINTLSIVVSGQAEPVAGDITGATISTEGGAIFKKDSGQWIVVGQYKSN